MRSPPSPAARRSGRPSEAPGRARGSPKWMEIDENAYQNISEGDEINIDVSLNEIKNITKNQTYKMKPFSEIIGKIIEAGGLFKYKPELD